MACQDCGMRHDDSADCIEGHGPDPVTAIPRLNLVRDAIERNYRGQPCPCCRQDDQAACPCEWPADPWGMTWCGECRRCKRVHCSCRKGFYDW